MSETSIARSDYGRALLAEARRWPGVTVSFHRGKVHPHALITYGTQSRKVFLACTGNDWKAPQFAVRDMRVALRAMGATPSERDSAGPSRSRRKRSPSRKCSLDLQVNTGGVPLRALNDPAPTNNIMAERLAAALKTAPGEQKERLNGRH